MTMDKLSSDIHLQHFDIAQGAIRKRWFKGTVGNNNAQYWEEAGVGPAHCLVTPLYSMETQKAVDTIDMLDNLAAKRGYQSAVQFNNNDDRTKQEVLDFLDEAKRIRIAELLDARVSA